MHHSHRSLRIPRTLLEDVTQLNDRVVGPSCGYFQGVRNSKFA